MPDQKTSVVGCSLDAYRTTGSSPTGSRAHDLASAFARPTVPSTPSGSPAGTARIPADPRTDGITSLPDIALEYGGILRGGRLAWRCWGDVDAPAVLVLGGISAGRDLTADGERRGWWTPFVGPGRACDTTRFRIIGIDYLGGPGDSTPARELPAPTFSEDRAARGALPGGPAPGEPLLSPRDQAAAIAALLGALGVRSLHACVGASYGGMVALALGAAFPARVDRLIVLGAAHEPHPMATALRALQRSIVRRGIATGDVRDALVLARALGVTTYRTAREFASRFGSPVPANAPAAAHAAWSSTPAVRDPAAAVEAYLRVQGERFAERFAPESYLCLSQSVDLHEVDPSRIRAATTCIAFEPDSIAPVWQIRAMTSSLRGPWSLRVLPSIYGHDAFLKEIEAITPIVADALGRPEVTR